MTLQAHIGRLLRRLPFDAAEVIVQYQHGDLTKAGTKKALIRIQTEHRREMLRIDQALVELELEPIFPSRIPR